MIIFDWRFFTNKKFIAIQLRFAFNCNCATDDDEELHPGEPEDDLLEDLLADVEDSEEETEEDTEGED